MPEPALADACADVRVHRLVAAPPRVGGSRRGRLEGVDFDGTGAGWRSGHALVRAAAACHSRVRDAWPVGRALEVKALLAGKIAIDHFLPRAGFLWTAITCGLLGQGRYTREGERHTAFFLSVVMFCHVHVVFGRLASPLGFLVSVTPFSSDDFLMATTVLMLYKLSDKSSIRLDKEIPPSIRT